MYSSRTARPKALGLRKPAAAFPEPARWPGTTQVRPLPTRPAPHRRGLSSCIEQACLLVPQSSPHPRRTCAGPENHHAPSKCPLEEVCLLVPVAHQPGRRPFDCGSPLPLSRSQPAGPAPFKRTCPAPFSNPRPLEEVCLLAHAVYLHTLAAGPTPSRPARVQNIPQHTPPAAMLLDSRREPF